MSKSRVYRLWQGIKKRCNAPTSQNYQYYGGRGIAVCRRWEESFDAFLSDMGEPPSPHHSIERIDNNGNYGPSNCKWIPQHLQVQNTRVTRDITIHGQTHCLSEWARRSGVPVATLKRRLDHGVNPERAILPDRMHRERKH